MCIRSKVKDVDGLFTLPIMLLGSETVLVVVSRLSTCTGLLLQ